MAYNYDDNYDLDEYGSGGLWASQHPGVRSALIMWGFLLVIAMINTFTGTTSLLFCYPIQLILYVANGYLAGYFALDSGRHPTEFARIGAIAGFVAWILPMAFYLIAGLGLGFVTLGVGTIVGLGVWFLCGPIDLAIHASCAAFGAWFYGRNKGEPDLFSDPYDSF